MSSQQLEEKFELIAKHLFTYFERTNFQTNTPRNVVDTFSLAGHHNKREFSIDFYYNSIRISTDFKRNGNQATLKMENTQINLNQKLGFDLVKDVRLENGELK
ncbi:unnamed protein product [Rotaria sp. Silwood2]|nr:unnamed protein product [Rotaria sp. Silwood2]CAF2941024.1 unnamed protein product [Rotaria sp. Silwood2]CAF3310455.1 unnamed protein product [Rotaria sp. Silwood2]CAF4290707.1 unnamed protein product [Rotaria sp. Silwood2]CAF4516028.1 unnamed protein product [Rotaria sp. Silwood2]